MAEPAFKRGYASREVAPLAASRPVRLAILCDMVEENWMSMDLVGEMLCEFLQRDHSDSFATTRVVPRMRRRLTRLRSNSRSFFNGDRLVNRFWDYQRWLRYQKQEFDLFHVIDHSYGQLLHHLPPERTIITCHDLDTFRCLVEPQMELRSRFFRQMTRHVLRGFRKAALVVCDSVAIRDELLARELIAPERLRVAPLGVHPACTPKADLVADAKAKRLLNHEQTNSVNLLHVGSTIKRKRIDVLLRVFAQLRDRFAVRLIRVGGPFTGEQMELVRQLKLESDIVFLPYLQRDVLAAVYRQAALVLQPSEGEGFGLPVIEAMACGTPVVASDLPVLREVGGEAAFYCPVADVKAWSDSVNKLLSERQLLPASWATRRAACLRQANSFSWSSYTQRMVSLYREILSPPARYTIRGLGR